MDNEKKLIISSRSAEGVVVFDIDGELSRWAAYLPTLSELVKAQVGSGKDRVLLNFEKTGFVDSFGVGEIVASFISLQNSGGALKLCRIPARLDLLFEFTGLKKVLPIYPTEEAAIEAFAKPPEPARPKQR
jgi:anti-anti-sigma factor